MKYIYFSRVHMSKIFYIDEVNRPIHLTFFTFKVSYDAWIRSGYLVSSWA